MDHMKKTPITKEISKILLTFNRMLIETRMINEGNYSGDNSGIIELVYNPVTGQGGLLGWGYDNGKMVSNISWEGHDNHLHISFSNKDAAMKIMDYAAQKGLHVRENTYSKEDPVVDPVHVKSSFHYSKFKNTPDEVRMAADISGDIGVIKDLILWIQENFIKTQQYPPTPNTKFEVDPLTQSTDTQQQQQQTKTNKENVPPASSSVPRDTFLYGLGQELGTAMGLKEKNQIRNNKILSEIKKINKLLK